MRLAELSRQDVKDLIAERAATGLARNTLTGMVTTIKAICNYAVEHEVIAQNPAARLGRFTRGRSEKEAHTIGAYTLEELTVLLDTAQRHYADEADLVMTLAWSGLRPGEGLGSSTRILITRGAFSR